MYSCVVVGVLSLFFQIPQSPPHVSGISCENKKYNPTQLWTCLYIIAKSDTALLLQTRQRKWPVQDRKLGPRKCQCFFFPAFFLPHAFRATALIDAMLFPAHATLSSATWTVLVEGGGCQSGGSHKYATRRGTRPRSGGKRRESAGEKTGRAANFYSALRAFSLLGRLFQMERLRGAESNGEFLSSTSYPHKDARTGAHVQESLK